MKPSKYKAIMKIVSGLVLSAVFLLYVTAKSGMVTDLRFFIMVLLLITMAKEIADFIFWRCTYCKKYLGQHKDAEFCKHCGRRIE